MPKLSKGHHMSLGQVKPHLLALGRSKDAATARSRGAEMLAMPRWDRNDSMGVVSMGSSGRTSHESARNAS